MTWMQDIRMKVLIGHTQCPTAGSRPSCHGHNGSYPMDLERFSRLSLTDNSLTRNPNEQNSFGIQHGHENIIRSVVPPRESSHMGINPSGKKCKISSYFYTLL